MLIDYDKAGDILRLRFSRSRLQRNRFKDPSIEVWFDTDDQLVEVTIHAAKQIATDLSRRKMYDPAADSLCIKVQPGKIFRDVSHDWRVNVGYSATGEVIEITFLEVSKAWK